MSDEKIDMRAYLEVIGNEATWALGKANAASDIFALLVGALAKTQPATAAELRRSLKALVESQDHVLNEDFEDIAKRLIEILDGDNDKDTFESVGPYISSRGVEKLKQSMFFPSGDGGPKKS